MAGHEPVAIDMPVEHLPSYDDLLLHRAVKDAGRWAYGIVIVEVWALSEDSTHLFRPDQGWWVDPVYEADQLSRLTDSKRADFVPPKPLSPGEGLPGALWVEASGSAGMFSRHGSVRRRSTLASNTSEGFGRLNRPVFWRDIQQLDADPDQPWNPRLKLFCQLGLGYAAAVPFHFGDHRGICVYIARQSVDMERLQSDTNQTYLMAASELIGAAYALRGPRHQVEIARREELRRALHRVKNKILAAKRMGMSIKQLVESDASTVKVEASTVSTTANSTAKAESFFQRLLHHLAMVLKKAKGGGAPRPPSFGWTESLLTFAGVWVTLMMIGSMQEAIAAGLGPNYRLTLGPFGALMTLLYGLAAAPASQPRNAMLGQTVAISIGISIGKVAHWPDWLRQSLSPAIAIAAMAKLGVIHPPAGASSLIFAAGGFGWGSLPMMLVANVIAIGAAILVNNLSDKRQYPSYWALIIVEATIGGCQSIKTKLEERQSLKGQNKSDSNIS